jgi:NADPH:quinone reductase-like Zn-dependent oxidoreductase
MRAIYQTELGGPEVLRLTERPRPVPGPTEVLVRVTAAGVNPLDWKTRERGVFLGAPPFTVGADVAGVVEQLSEGVTRFAVGERVFGMPRFPRAAAAYADYVTAPARHLARSPARATDAEAAALPMAGLTAWQALVDTAAVQPGERVLVHAAAGGIGHLAVQIAKALGAYVVGTARAEKHAFLAELGVDEAMDPTRLDPGEVLRGMDVVLDLVGGDTAVRSLPVLRDGGILVGVSSGTAAAEAAAGQRVQVAYLLVEPDHRGLEAIAALVDAGRLTVHVARTFPLAEAADAHRAGEAGHGRGKLVLTVGA